MKLTDLNRSTKWRNLTIGILIFGLSLGGTVWAGPHMHRQRGGYPEPGKIYRRIPSDHQSLRVGHDRYCFHKGVYYRQDHRGYRVARPPRGAVIHHMPLGFETLVVAGITYFLLAGVFYQKSPAGYVVVDSPPVVAVPPVGMTGTTGQTLVVSVAVLNVRSGPGLDHPVVNQLRLGDRLIIQGSSIGWYYVLLPDESFGWVMAPYTQVTAPYGEG